MCELYAIGNDTIRSFAKLYWPWNNHTCRDINAERKNVALPMPPIKLLVSETNHSPSKIHGTGVIPVPRKNSIRTWWRLRKDDFNHFVIKRTWKNLHEHFSRYKMDEMGKNKKILVNLWILSTFGVANFIIL